MEFIKERELRQKGKKVSAMGFYDCNQLEINSSSEDPNYESFQFYLTQHMMIMRSKYF